MNEMFLRFCYIQEGFRLNLLSSASACSGLAYVLRLFPKKKIYILLWMKKKAPQVFKLSLCSVCVFNGKDRQMIKKKKSTSFFSGSDNWKDVNFYTHKILMNIDISVWFNFTMKRTLDTIILFLWYKMRMISIIKDTLYTWDFFTNCVKNKLHTA